MSMHEFSAKELHEKELELTSRRSEIYKEEALLRAEIKRREDEKRSMAATFISNNKEMVLTLMALTEADTEAIRFIEEEDYWDFDLTLQIQVVKNYR